MSTKKRSTYNDLSRIIQEAQEKQEKERQRLASIMSASFLDDINAGKLSEYKDKELKHIMNMYAHNFPSFLKNYEAQKQAAKATFQPNSQNVLQQNAPAMISQPPSYTSL